MTTTAANDTASNSTASLNELVNTHRDLLERASEASRTREFFSAYPESPSPRVYGEDAAPAGEADYNAMLDGSFDLHQPNDGTTVGSEVSPYGPRLGVAYPHATVDQLIDAATAALPGWRAATPIQRAAIGVEILNRINAQSFAMAHAVMHTSGQAFVMAFQAGGPHAQDRGLEAVTYGWQEQERIAPTGLWEKPQGKRPPLQMITTFTPVSRGIGLLIGCNTFPTWNSYSGLFASLVTGNTVIVKPHPQAILPLAITVRIAREVLAEYGFDPNVVLLAPDDDGEGLARDLATHPAVGIVDFTGSTAFGTWVENNARQAQVYTEKAGVNSVILESTAAYRAALDNLAFTLSLYSGQMCTTTQTIYIPAAGIATDEGAKSPDDVARDLGEALGKLLGDDARAAGILGAIVNDDVAARLDRAASASDVAVPSRQVAMADWPDARIRTPLVRVVDADATDEYAQECFGPVTFVVRTRDRDHSLSRLEHVTTTQGALTAGVHSTDETFLERTRQTALRSGVALSENLTGGVFVNQTAAFTDFHATGANPAANAAYTDAHFVAGRFRFIEIRRPAPDPETDTAAVS